MNLFISADAFEAAVEASPAHKATLNHRRRKVAEYRLQQHNGHNGAGWGTAETVSCVPVVAVPCMGWLIVFLLTQCLLLKWRKRKGFYPKASRYAARCYKVYIRRKCALDRKVIRLYIWYIVLRYILDIKVLRAKVRCKKKLISIFDRCKLICVNVTVSIYCHVPPMRVSAAVIFLGLLMSGNVELNPGPKQDVQPTLKELMKRLDGSVAKWRPIGVQLDFQKADLDDINQINPTDNWGCLNELMGRWLERGDASWSNLVDALENCRVNKKIIDSITSDYYDDDEYEKAIEAGSIEIQATKATFSGISGSDVDEYEKAIVAGYIELHATKVTLSGVPGSGKSTLCALLMDDTPPSIHNSTPVAKEAIQATAEKFVHVDEETWKHVDRDQLQDMIIHTLDTKEYEMGTSKQEGSKSEARDRAPNPKVPEDQFLEKTKSKESVRSKLREKISELKQNKRGGNVLSFKHLVYLVDVGGQFQFQEIVPLFVRNASVNVIVIKLSSKLADKSKNVYCIDGVNKIAEPKHMVHSLEDFIVNTIDSVFSLKKKKLDIKQVKKAPDEPKVALVGTFSNSKDENMEEPRKSKQDALKKNDVFKKHIEQDHIITFDGEHILDIDGSKDGYQKEDNKKKLKQLRKAILTRVSKLEVNVPISWFLLLLDIQSESDKHDFITFARCCELGEDWEIESYGVDAALRYFDELNLILYFPSTCPGTVFCNPQFLLGKVTDMIVASFLIPEVDEMSGSRKQFRDYGIFGRKLFNTGKHTEGFNEHFSQDHLLELMQDRLIIAKVSGDSKQRNKGSKEDEIFFMPCVLKMEEETLLSHIDQGFSPVEPLIITFTHESSPRGLFCATIVSLLQSAKEKTSKLKWVLASSDKLVRKRNKVEFEMFDPPPPSIDAHKFSSNVGTITLEDNLKNFIVCIRGDTLIDKCFGISKDLEESLEKACEKLRCEGYSFAVLCPRCKDKHPVKLLRDYKWKCENEPYTGDTGNLSIRQLPWFKEDCTKDKGIKRARSESDGSSPLQKKHPRMQSEHTETPKVCMMQQPNMESRIGMNQGHYIQGYNSMHHMVGGAYPQNYIMVAGQQPPHETMLTATQPQMQIGGPPSQQALLMQQLLHQQRQLQAQQHMQMNVSPIPGLQQLCSAPPPPLFVGGAQQQQLPASFGSGVSTGFGEQSQQQQTLALQQQFMAQAPSAGGSSTTAQPLGQQQQQTLGVSVGSSGQAQMPDPIPSPKRVVKPGSIKEPDRLFNQLAKEIGDKYKQVGIDLGLTFQNQQNALETGPYANAQADQRALKMLNLWQKQSPDKDFTYSILATALEKNDLQRSADKYCYMDPPGS